MRYITNKNGKIDLLKLIPRKTESGFEVKKEVFINNSEEWVRAWYKHPRRPELRIRRHIDASIYGSLLGQMQAEGTKAGKRFRVEFSNKLISEHKDFVESLEAMGISRSKMNFYLIDSENRNQKVLDKHAKKFEKAIDSYPKIYHHPSMRGGIAFKTVIRNTIFTELLLNSMDLFRKLITQNPDKIKIIADSFFAKLLTGDGTLDVDKRVPPRVAIKITDKNIGYLKDYEIVFRKLRFSWTNLDLENITVKASCSFENLLYLYQIKAFKNTNNWSKLLVTIGLCLKGRRLKTKLRFLDLEKLRTFSSFDLRDKYNICLRSANDWLTNARKQGYIKCINSTDKPYKYQLTEKTKELNRILREWKEDLKKLIKLKRINNLSKLLKALKVRST